MYRGPSTSGLMGGGGGLYAAERLEALKKTAAGYSRRSKPYQVLGLTFRRHGWLCVLLATFLLCGAIVTVGLMDMSVMYRAILPQARKQYHQELAMLIKEAQFERSELIVEMAKVHEVFVQMKAEVEDKAMKRREQQAEYDRVSEIHRGRLDASAADIADDNTREEGQAELDAGLAALEEAVGQHNYATWTEYSKWEKLQRLRHEITALTLAIDDMTAERTGKGRPSGLLKGHPAKLLKSSQVKPSGAVFDRTKLTDMYKSEMTWSKMPDGYYTDEGRRDLKRFVAEAIKDWEAHSQRLAAAREAARRGREPLSLRARNREAEGKEASPAELMRGLRSAEALPGYREASEHLGRLHAAGDQRPGLVGPVLGQGQGLDGLGGHAEGLREGTSGGTGRALAANVLWLDANPDAKSDLARARPGAGDIALEGRVVSLAEDSTLATKILAGTRGGAATLTEQDGNEVGMSGIDSEAARHKARRDAASGLAGAQDAGRPPGAKPATAAKGGQAGSGQLGGEAARHRAHRASLMGLPLKQQAATQAQKHAEQQPIGPVDESVRCRMSGICEGALACQPGSEEVLGCITNSTERQGKVKDAMLWSWQGYREYAWGQDELKPISKTHSMWFNLGLTLVDSLDTLLIMGMKEAFLEARDWVESSLAVNPDNDVNLFETTIRVLGGLLSAFHLSAGDQMLLYKAADLGMRLSAAFKSDTGIPYSDVNLQTHNVHQPPWTQFSSLSEVSTLSLEFTYLERAAGEPAGGQPSIDVVEKLMRTDGRTDGLAPFYVDPANGALSGGILTLGARGDSYYEYMLKQWLLSGKQQQSFLRGYKESMQGVRRKLLQRTAKAGGLLYVAEMHGGSIHHKMDHLVCFLPGLLALGHMHGVNTGKSGQPDDLAIARELMRTCYEMYARTPTGLAPEIVHFVQRDGGSEFPKQHEHDVGGGDFTVTPQDAHNLLRPESMESLFVLWRVTRDPVYREWGWLMFRAWEKFSRVSTGGYTCLDSVLQVPPVLRDKMESFWPAETLKYLYLLLDESQPELLPLDQFVFNTEAHPLPIIGSMADAEAAKWYVKGPQNNSTQRAPPAQSLEERAQDWGSALKVIGNANAYTAWNMSRSEKALRSREALLRAALTGEAFHSSAILR